MIIVVIYFLILGDRAKINKLVQMAWTFSNDRFVSLVYYFNFASDIEQ